MEGDCPPRHVRPAYGRAAARCRSLVIGVATIVALVVPARAQQANEDDIKAAFLFNLAKFVEWPPDAFADANAPMVVGIAGDGGMFAAFNTVTHGKTVNGRAFMIKRLRRTDDLRGVHILFVSERETRNIQPLLDAAKGRSTLTVGESERFSDAGGMITFLTDNHRIQFNINVESTDHAQLRVSSKLLVLARRVIGDRRGGGS